MRKYLAYILIFAISMTSFGFVQKHSNVSSIDGLTLQKESKKFVFYSKDADRKCLKELSQILESSYTRIVKDLNTSIKRKTRVLIYPDIDQFHKAYGDPNASDSIVGSAWNDRILMVSPLKPGGIHNYKSLLSVIIHEFTHVVIGSVHSDLSNLPVYLNEGIAVYESNQMNDKSKAFLKDKVKKDNFLKLSELENGVLENGNFIQEGGYLFSYSVVDFIIDEFGRDKLVELVKEPTNFEKILGESKIVFENQWKNDMRKKYK